MAGILDRLDNAGEDGGFSPKQQALFALAGMLAQASERGARTGAGLTGALAGAAGQYQQAVDVKRENRRAQVKDEINKALLEKQKVENESEKRRRDMLAGILGDMGDGGGTDGEPRGGLLGRLTDEQKQALALLPSDEQARMLAKSAFPSGAPGRVVNLPIGNQLVPHVFDPATGQATPIPGTGGPRFAPQSQSSRRYSTEIFTAKDENGKLVFVQQNPETGVMETLGGARPLPRLGKDPFGNWVEVSQAAENGGGQQAQQTMAEAAPGQTAGRMVDVAGGAGLIPMMSRGFTELFAQAGIGEVDAEEVAAITRNKQLALVQKLTGEAFTKDGRTNLYEVQQALKLAPSEVMNSPATSIPILIQLKRTADQFQQDAEAMARRTDLTAATRSRQSEAAERFRKLSAAIGDYPAEAGAGGGSTLKRADDAARKYLGK